MSNPNLVRKIADSSAGTSGEVSFSDILDQNPKMRNFVMNGNFEWWQRGTSLTFTGNGYLMDRWFAGATGSVNYSQQAASPPTGSTAYARITFPASGNNINDFYYLEDFDVAPLKGKTVTWSMLVRRSASLNNGWTLRVFKNATANTRLGGSWTQIHSTVFSDSDIPTSGWGVISVTFDVPDDGTANGLRLNMVNTVNPTTPGVYIEIAQMMLNIGTERLSEFVPYARNSASELLVLQRYYQQRRQGWGIGAGRHSVPLSPYMRASPTVITISTGGVVFSTDDVSSINWTFTKDANNNTFVVAFDADF